VLTLKLFGAPAVEAGGELVAGRAVQGHRLALLALLALARGRPVARDRITALLWPENSTDRARHQLSDSLYIARSALGTDIIRSTGDDVVLNADAVTSDVATFERLLDEGALEQAVESFAGPLLDGFHLPDGGEFERWLDGERQRLAQRHTSALESLADGSETRGDYAAAEKWWRRLAAHDPYSGRVALRLMRALDAAGDRAGALRHARIHEALLREEFEAEPDPAVTAFAERIRVEPPARAVPERAAKADPEPEPNEAVDVVEAKPVAPRPAPNDTFPARASKRRHMRTFAAAGSVVLLVVLALAWNGRISRAREAPPTTARSIAVLPFVNMSPDSATGYFSDGLSEQIITALSRIPGLHVAARTSSFALRDDRLDVRVIGDTLGVEVVLEGSVRREGRTLRVTAQLIDARTGYHLWADEYDREVTDALALQDEIAGAIASALELRLPARAAPSPMRQAPNPAAYDLYLRALHLRDDMSGDAMLAAMELLDRAIEIEPGFALAWAEKANVVGPLINYGHVPRERGLAEMRTAVARALELDPELGEAHVALGILRLFHEWDWEGGERALRRAVELNPNDPHAWHNLGNQLIVAGRIEEAVAAGRRGVALDPLNARLRGILAVELMTAGRHDEALAEYERARDLDPMNPNVLGTGPGVPIGAEIHAARGRPENAVEELVRIAALRGAMPAELDALRAAFAKGGMPHVWRSWLAMDLRLTGGAVNPLRRALLHAFGGETEPALDWLERAYAARVPVLIFVQRYAAVLPEVRSHPRYMRIVAEMKLAPQQPPR
jgi:TolB-like protein/DNA-binding SARP family transcriptional activator/Flp pilus assembly protein TadD